MRKSSFALGNLELWIPFPPTSCFRTGKHRTKVYATRKLTNDSTTRPGYKLHCSASKGRTHIASPHFELRIRRSPHLQLKIPTDPTSGKLRVAGATQTTETISKRPNSLQFFSCCFQLNGVISVIPPSSPNWGNLHWNHCDTTKESQNGWGWKGPLEIIQVQPPAQSRVSQSGLHKTMFKWVLNISSDEDSTTFQDNDQTVCSFSFMMSPSKHWILAFLPCCTLEHERFIRL